MGRLGKFVSPLLAMFLSGCATLQSTTNSHGPAAKEIAHLSNAMSITFVITIVIMWALLVIALKNRGSLQEHMPINVGGGQDWVWIGGVAIPLLVLTVFFFLGLNLLRGFPIHGDHGAMNSGSMGGGSKPDILVIGHQWWWEVHYLGASGQQVPSLSKCAPPMSSTLSGYRVSTAKLTYCLGTSISFALKPASLVITLASVQSIAASSMQICTFWS
jgi:heme/copper-type cytochrome/quinol oxidase subunit 2